MKRTFCSFLAILLSLCVFGAVSGCSKKTEKTNPGPRKTQASTVSQTATAPEAEPAGHAAADSPSGIQKISDNPVFFTAKDLSPQAPEALDLDGLLRPVFKNLFEDVKLTEEIGKQPPSADGEVEENQLIYVTRRLLDEADGDELHRVLYQQKGFSRTPRLGAKPTHSRTAVFMSLSKSTSRRGYSLVIVVDFGKQQLRVISYRLGSKYDRLM